MSITTIIGPMFSGKTDQLISRIERKRISGKKCLIIKNSSDDRYDSTVGDSIHVTTHMGLRYALCDIISIMELSQDTIDDIIGKYDVVGIDEGFFFKNITHFCNELANNNIYVIVSTLDGSYQQKIFPHIGDLIAVSEKIIKLNSVCMNCHDENAAFTLRIADKNNNKLVGGIDMYKSVCRKCLIKSKHTI